MMGAQTKLPKENEKKETEKGTMPVGRAWLLSLALMVLKRELVVLLSFSVLNSSCFGGRMRWGWKQVAAPISFGEQK